MAPMSVLLYTESPIRNDKPLLSYPMAKQAVNAIVRDYCSSESLVKSLSMRQQRFALSGDPRRLDAFGFKLNEGGAHTSRTIMLREITRLLAVGGADATVEDYRRLIVSENALGKATDATRLETARRLRELYGLSSKVPIFALYRQLINLDLQSAPLLSLLITWARDPLFRATTAAVSKATVGDKVTGSDFQDALTEVYPHHYSATTIGNIARHAASSWTQSGHLVGRTNKIRSRVQPRPAAVAFALMLGHVAGLAGEQLFSSIWCRLLDLNLSDARSLAEQAHRQELLTLRAIGTVVEINFPRYQQFLKGF